MNDCITLLNDLVDAAQNYYASETQGWQARREATMRLKESINQAKQHIAKYENQEPN